MNKTQSKNTGYLSIYSLVKFVVFAEVFGKLNESFKSTVTSILTSSY